MGLFGAGQDSAGALLVAAGDNPDRLHSEAAFSMLCGSSPIQASSGKTVRHRLNRGGNRQANAALYRIVLVRLRWHQPTKHYLTRRLAEGKSKAGDHPLPHWGTIPVAARGSGRGFSAGVRGWPRCRAARRPVCVLPPSTPRDPQTGFRDLPAARAEQ